MGMQWAEHSIEIAATPDQVFDAITDYETFPGWQSAVLATEVTEREAASGLGEVVEYEVDGKIRTIRYTLRYHYDRPEKISWDFLEGHGINRMDGGYELRESDGGTSATYRVGIDVSGIPGPILKHTHKATIKKANQDLKAEAERRASSPRSSEAEAEAKPEPAASPEPEPAASPELEPAASPELEPETEAASVPRSEPRSEPRPEPPAAAAPADEEHPFDMLPGPLPELARLPGRIMVKIGRRLGG
jgi:carbon monoxide dehydrogenase subunit G